MGWSALEKTLLGGIAGLGLAYLTLGPVYPLLKLGAYTIGGASAPHVYSALKGTK